MPLFGLTGIWLAPCLPLKQLRPYLLAICSQVCTRVHMYAQSLVVLLHAHASRDQVIARCHAYPTHCIHDADICHTCLSAAIAAWFGVLSLCELTVCKTHALSF